MVFKNRCGVPKCLILDHAGWNTLFGQDRFCFNVSRLLFRVIFMGFFVCSLFSKLSFKSFKNATRVSNSLDLDQDRYFRIETG